MKNTMSYPEYKCSIVNLMASIQKHYDVPTNYETIECVDKELSKDYQHVLLMVFDGLGAKALTHHLDELSFFRQHMTMAIQSVYPSTTTAAMTSYYTGVSPAEHGWLGWSLYFRDYGAMIDLFTNCNSYTGKVMDTKRIAYRELPFKSVYEKIHEQKGEQVNIHTIKPETIYFPSGSNRHHPIRDLKHMKKVLMKVNQQTGFTFTAAYWPNPDMLMHEFGPYDINVKDNIQMLNDFVEDLSKDLTDTLIIISADHGLTNITKEYDLHKDIELNKMLIIPPSVEGRAASFFVKQNELAHFRQVFEDKYGDEFVLYSHKEVVENQLFGKGVYHQKLDDFIGDYVACATGHSILHYKTTGGKNPHHFKGHHAGLTEEEMKIPLIIIGCE